MGTRTQPSGHKWFLSRGGGGAEIGRKGEREEINRQHIGNHLFLNNKPSKQFSSSSQLLHILYTYIIL